MLEKSYNRQNIYILLCGGRFAILGEVEAGEGDDYADGSDGCEVVAKHDDGGDECHDRGEVAVVVGGHNADSRHADVERPEAEERSDESEVEEVAQDYRFGQSLDREKWQVVQTECCDCRQHAVEEYFASDD